MGRERGSKKDRKRERNPKETKKKGRTKREDKEENLTKENKSDRERKRIEEDRTSCDGHHRSWNEKNASL